MIGYQRWNMYNHISNEVYGHVVAHNLEGNSQIRNIFYFRVWKDDSLALVDHVEKLFIEKILVQESGGMGPSLYCFVTLSNGPWWTR